MTGHRASFLVILGLVGHAIYQLANILGTVNDWSILWQPPTVAQLLIIGGELITGVVMAFGTDMAKVKDPTA